jgi:hypothetical protein
MSLKFIEMSLMSYTSSRLIPSIFIPNRHSLGTFIFVAPLARSEELPSLFNIPNFTTKRRKLYCNRSSEFLHGNIA